MSIIFFIVAKKGQKRPNCVPPKSNIKKHPKTTFRRISFKKLLKRRLRRISFGPVSKSTASTHFFFQPPLRRISFSKRLRSSTHFFTLNRSSTHFFSPNKSSTHFFSSNRSSMLFFWMESRVDMLGYGVEVYSFS